MVIGDTVLRELTESADGFVTVKLKVVVLDTSPPVPMTVIVWVPAGMVAGILIVSVVEELGEQEGGENEAVAPIGKPETEKETGLVIPELTLQRHFTNFFL